MKMLFPLLMMSVLLYCGEPAKKRLKFDYICKSKKSEDCEQDRLRFLQQYQHRGNHGESYSHNFILQNNQVLHISSNQEIIVEHNKDSNRVDIHIK